MPSPRQEEINAHKRLLRMEDSTARLVSQAYEEARRDIVATLLEAFEQLGRDPESVRLLARDVGLIREIDLRLAELGREYRGIVRAGLNEAQEVGLEQAEREIARLVDMLGITISPFTGVDPALPQIVDSLMRQVEVLGEGQRRLLTSELTAALIRGDDVPTIVGRLLAIGPGPDGVSLARRGVNSALLLTRKVIIGANNASRQLVYLEAREDVPGLKKQLIAALQPDRTTETCLRAHGQIREIDEPYVLTGRPRYARRIMYPPFHDWCRSSSVAYHAEFEENTKMTTEVMREAAAEALEEKKRMNQ